MSQGFEIIRARIKDGAVILINRLMRSKQQEVVLVLPKNSIIAADLNSLKILKEEAESIGKILSLSTENNEIKSFAKKIKMLIYDPSDKDEKQAKSNKKIKIMMDILPPSFNRAPEEDNISEKEEHAVLEEPIIYEAASRDSDLEKNLENFYNSKPRLSAMPTVRQAGRWHSFYLNHTLPTGRQAISLFFISGLLLFGATMYLILPKADLRISLKEISLKAQIPIAVSKNISSSNLASGIIPGQYFSLNKTGSKIIEGHPKIGGVIEIYNAYSAVSQKLIAETRFETKDGKIFRIKNPVIVPGAKMLDSKLVPSSIKAEVIGESTSDEYLIGPSYFTIPGFKETPKYAGFYAKSIEPMAILGNTFISEEELEKNKNELKDKLAQELKSDILGTLKDSDLKLLDGASVIKIDYFKINVNKVNVNEKSLDMKITWQALFFKERDLKTVINYFISNHYSDLKNFIFEDKIEYPKASRVDFKKGELFFTFNIDKNNALPFDLDSLKKELAGRNENGMRTIISDKTYINSASISLWPFWVSRAPNNLKKINITIDNK